MREAVPWVVAGRYEVGEVVGRGGYGMVRRALDRQTGQPVAMKVLSAEAGKDPHLVERMLREQQAMVAMAGTCAVTAVDLCRLASGAPCLVMEWLDGRDLERQLTDWEAEGQRPSLESLLEIVRPLTDTLQRAHDLGIVHRDIKPANVFLTTSASSSEPNGAVRLLDFGLSRMRSSAPLTAVGMVMGSPSYIPPETWRGNSTLIDHRADLYSLGVIVFRALAGRLPFETPSLIEKLKLVTSGERPSVCALRPDLPSTVDAWMKRALAIEPDQRFQSARDFYESLTRALNGAPIPFADEELSSVRERASTPLPAENRNVLSVAWERATSLLHRFIGQKGAAKNAQAEHSLLEPEASQEVSALRAADGAVGSVGSHLELASVAWLDDQDLEDLPTEPALAAKPRATKTRSQSKPRTRKAESGAKKKPTKAPKAKQKKPRTSKRGPTAVKKTRQIKAKPSGKGR